MKKITFIIALLFTGIISAQTIGEGSNTLTGAGAEIAVDEISITNDNDTLKLLDRSSNIAGQKGYKRPLPDFNWSDIPSSYANSIIEIRYDYDLGTDTIALPENVTLKFNGGIFKNGTINLNGAEIIGKDCFDDDIVLSNNVDGSVVRFDWFGIKSGILDMTLVNSIFSFSGFEGVFISSGIYEMDGTIDNTNALSIYSDGKIVLDAEDSASDTVLNVGEISTTLIETLSTTFPRFSKTYTFTSHSLVKGDIIFFLDDDNGSLAPYRDNYKKGEYLRVDTVDGNDVTFETPTIFEYGSGDIIHKAILNEFDLNADLEIISPTINTSITVVLTCIKDSTIDRLTIKNASATGVLITKSLGVAFTNQNIRGERLTGEGKDYALIVANSKDIIVKGHFKSSRHAFSIGGDLIFPMLTNQNIYAEGVFETDNAGEVTALDVHGNTIGYTFRGFVNGGVNCRGADGRIECTIRAGFNGVGVFFSEILNYNHNLSNSIINGNGINPHTFGLGIVDFGGNTIPNTYATNEGTLNFSNVTINAPGSQNPFKIVNPLAAGQSVDNVIINLSNVNVMEYDSGLGHAVWVRNFNAGDEWKMINLTGFSSKYNSSLALSTEFANTKVLQSPQGGRIAFNPSTSASEVTGSVTFTIPFMRVPNVSAVLENATFAGEMLISVYSITTTGFSYKISTVDGTNFSSNSTTYFNYLGS